MNQSLFVTRRKEAKPRKPGSRRCSGAKGNVTQRRVSDADETRKTATEELRSRMIKDPDWLIKQRTNRPQFNLSRTACTVVLIHYAMLKKSIKSFAAIFEKSRIKCYFLQRLLVATKMARQVAVSVCYTWQFLVQLACETKVHKSVLNSLQYVTRLKNSGGYRQIIQILSKCSFKRNLKDHLINLYRLLFKNKFILATGTMLYYIIILYVQITTII